MQSGKLRHRLTILARAVTQNKYGEKADQWGEEVTVWGGIRPLGVVEAQEAAKQVGNVSHMVTLRAPGLSVGPEKRIRFGTRIFEVVGQMNWDERGERLQVTCRETV